MLDQVWKGRPGPLSKGGLGPLSKDGPGSRVGHLCENLSTGGLGHPNTQRSANSYRDKSRKYLSTSKLQISACLQGLLCMIRASAAAPPTIIVHFKSTHLYYVHISMQYSFSLHLFNAGASVIQSSLTKKKGSAQQAKNKNVINTPAAQAPSTPRRHPRKTRIPNMERAAYL